MDQFFRLYIYENLLKLRIKLPRAIQEGYAEDQPVLVPSLCLTGAVRLVVIRAVTAKSFNAPLSHDDASIAKFHLPFKKPELLAKWKRFVSLNNWTPTNSSVLCEKHFEGHYIKRGNRTTLQWDQNPIPTIQSTMALKRPASFPPVEMLRKPPKIRNICPDQLPEFKV